MIDYIFTEYTKKENIVQQTQILGGVEGWEGWRGEEGWERI